MQPRPWRGRAAERSCPPRRCAPRRRRPSRRPGHPVRPNPARSRVPANRSPATTKPWKRRKRLRTESWAKNATSPGTSPSTGARRRRVAPSRRITSTAMSESCIRMLMRAASSDLAALASGAAAEAAAGKPQRWMPCRHDAALRWWRGEGNLLHDQTQRSARRPAQCRRVRRICRRRPTRECRAAILHGHSRPDRP